MAATFEVQGPFDIPYEGAGLKKYIGPEHVQEFWSQDGVAELADMKGCYVFAIRAGGGYTPRYVGQTTRGFHAEAFQQRLRYNDSLQEGTKGRPVMFFVAMRPQKGPTPASQIDELESFLIQQAYLKNPDLLNVAKTNIPEWRVLGVVRDTPGRPSAAALEFRKALGIRK